MSTHFFTTGANGGTGKSTAVRFLLTYLRAHGLDPMLLDLDDENRTLSRFFPEALKIEIKRRLSHGVLVERAPEGSPLILADLKAGTRREWGLDVPFEELQPKGVAFICLASITSSPDSVQSFLNWVAALKDRVRYVVFKNLKDGDSLLDYDGSDEVLHFRQEFSPLQVVIPRLDEECATELERLDLTITEVLDGSSGKSARGKAIGPAPVRLMVRARLRRYQEGIYRQLDPVLEILNSSSKNVCGGMP